MVISVKLTEFYGWLLCTSIARLWSITTRPAKIMINGNYSMFYALISMSIILWFQCCARIKINDIYNWELDWWAAQDAKKVHEYETTVLVVINKQDYVGGNHEIPIIPHAYILKPLVLGVHIYHD